MTPDDFAQSRTRECTASLMRLAARSLRRAVDELPGTVYVVDDGGKQAGERRIEVFNEVNRPQMYAASTAGGFGEASSIYTLNDAANNG